MTPHRIIFLLLFLFAFNYSFSQDFPSDLWHEGKVVLIDGDTLKGQIKYDFKNDLIQLNFNGILRTFSSRKIFYFEIFDSLAGSYRYFYSLPFSMHSNYEAPILFEVLYEGKLTLLSREEIVTENVNTPSYNYYYYPSYPYSSYTRERLAYRFFFLEENGEIKYYNLKKNELEAIFSRHYKEINQYMKKNNLKYNELRDLVRITAYYNSLLGS